MNIVSVFAWLLQDFALGLTAEVSPGSFQTYLISQSLAGGWVVYWGDSRFCGAFSPGAPLGP